MGEFSEMVLEGILCQHCGVLLSGPEQANEEPPGYPCSCEACSIGWGEPGSRSDTKAKQPCPICGRRKRNIDDHIKAVHGEGIEL